MEYTTILATSTASLAPLRILFLLGIGLLPVLVCMAAGALRNLRGFAEIAEEPAMQIGEGSDVVIDLDPADAGTFDPPVPLFAFTDDSPLDPPDAGFLFPTELLDPPDAPVFRSFTRAA